MSKVVREKKKKKNPRNSLDMREKQIWKSKFRNSQQIQLPSKSVENYIYDKWK